MSYVHKRQKDDLDSRALDVEHDDEENCTTNCLLDEDGRGPAGLDLDFLKERAVALDHLFVFELL